MSNHEGLVQIGDLLLRMDDEKVKYTHIDHKAELEKKNSTYVQERKVIDIPMQVSRSNAKTSADYDDSSVIHEYKPSGLSERRFQRRYFAKSFFVGIVLNGPDYVLEAGVTMFHQRKNWWGWGGQDTDGWEHGTGLIAVTGSGVSDYIYFPVESYSGNTTEYGIAYFREYDGGPLSFQCQTNYIKANKNGGGIYDSGYLGFYY